LVRTRPILKPKFSTRKSKFSTTCAEIQAEKEASYSSVRKYSNYLATDVEEFQRADGK
jgi:hypothetical protein